MQHDAQPAIAFLRWLRPTGLWILTAIAVDRQGIDTKSIDAGDADAVEKFLRIHGDRNVYYTLNPTVRALDIKPKKIHIAAVEFLHVDVDPRVPDPSDSTPELRAAHNARERDRILAKLTAPPAPIPAPSAIIASGGGYQGLLRLVEPLPIVGESDTDREASCEDVERYNLALEWALGGDHCHNVDRILRLPGTVNYPDEKKRALKGRVKALSAIVEINDHAYPISAFTPAQPVQAPAARGSLSGGRARTAKAVASSGNIDRYTIDQLSQKLPKLAGYAKVVIVQGFHPDEPHKRDGHRSEWLFYVCCELVRAGADDDLIYSVVTDPDFAISASVLDKGSTRDRYAWRQIDRAKEEAIHPRLRELNEKHAVIANFGGDCVVIEEHEDPILKRPHLTTQSFTAIRNRYMTQKIELGQDAKGNPIKVPLGVWWLEHEARRQYDRIVFAPGADVPGAYNLWQGFAVEARPGDNDASFIAHIRETICGGDEVIFDYVLKWCARAVQEPATPGEVALVLRGDEGTGKGTFVNIFGALFGRHYLHVSNAQHLVGNFNAHLQDAVLVFADEAFYAGDKRHESVLKTLVTEHAQMIERKGYDSTQSPNFAHIVMAANGRWVIPAGFNSRRFCVIDVPKTHMQESEANGHFAAIRTDMKKQDGIGLSNLLYRLLNLDLSGFNVRAFPRTSALRDQKILSLDSVDEWLFGKLEDGILLPDHVGWTAPVLKQALLDDYLNYAQQLGARRSPSTQVGARLVDLFGEKLRRFRAPVKVWDEARGHRTDRLHFYEFPDLAYCRKCFEDTGLGEYPWPEIELRGSIPDEATRVYVDDPPEDPERRSPF